MDNMALSSQPTPLRLLVLGYGNVVRAFLPLLASRSAWLGRELGMGPLLIGLGSRSNGLYIHAEGIQLNQASEVMPHLKREGVRVESFEQFIEMGKAAGADVFIELTSLDPHHGEPALTYIRKALKHDMDVITANKGPVAHALRELRQLAREHHVQFRFESTVIDGVPVFNLAEYCLPAVGIRSFRALLNSTTNLVLRLIEQGYTLDEAVQQAQHIGVAEADPSFDLDGWDAVMKTTILANVLLDAQLTPQMVWREGMRNLTEEAIRLAARSGTPYRLVSETRPELGKLIAAVSPQQIAAGDILYRGKDFSGILSLETEALGTITIVEHEPATLQTAYGVLSDLIAIVRNR
jgi:homoserine dehydrogenase